jgi:hypothetical protein
VPVLKGRHLKPKLRRSRRGLLASGASLLVLLVFVFGGFGYFFSSAAQQRHDIVMPVPGLPDLAGDQAAAYGKFVRDGALNAALVEPAFTQVRSRLDGVRVVFVPSYLSDVALPSVALGKSLGYMAGIYSWLGDAGIETEIADIETEDSVVANAARLQAIMARDSMPVCFVTHSKGGLDVLEYLRTASRDERARVRCWVAMQAPFLGSPVADLATDVAGLPEIASVLLEALGGQGESLSDLTTRERLNYMAEHRGEITKVLDQVSPLCLATYVPDPGAFEKPTSWSYPALVWMHDSGVANDGLVAVRSALEICPRSLMLTGLDHTGIVAPGLVALIDQEALMKALLVLALDTPQ